MGKSYIYSWFFFPGPGFAADTVDHLFGFIRVSIEKWCQCTEISTSHVFRLTIMPPKYKDSTRAVLNIRGKNDNE